MSPDNRYLREPVLTYGHGDNYRPDQLWQKAASPVADGYWLTSVLSGGIRLPGELGAANSGEQLVAAGVYLQRYSN